VKVFLKTVYVDFETAIHNAVTTWSDLEVKYSILFPIRTELVAENAIFVTHQAVWKERL